MSKKQAAVERANAPQQRRSAAATNTHERQARQAAARILSGETDVARLLTRAPAAARVEPGKLPSRGERLPDAVRNVLERGFGADLSAVRLHHHEAAGELVGRDGARAFASGPDIFFAPGAYQPLSADGLRLIAHEAAHVLQQTGVTAEDGIWTATARYGSADVQRDDPAPMRPWWQLRDEYRAQHVSESEDARKSLEGMITVIEELVGADGTLSVFTGVGVDSERKEGTKTIRTNNMTEFENRVKKGEFNASDRAARSLLLDVLKLLGRYEGAAYLLGRDRLLPTHINHGPFLVYLHDSPEYGIDWFTQTFNEIPEIRVLFPDRFLENIWRYLINPERRPISSKDVRDAVEAYKKRFEEQYKTSFYLDNERVRGAWLSLNEINEWLQTSLKDLEKTVSEEPSASRRHMAAYNILMTAQRWATNDRRFLRALSNPTAKIAQQAIDFWSKGGDRQSDLMEASMALFYEIAKSMPVGEQTGAAGDAAAPTIALIPDAVQKNKVFAGFLKGAKTNLQAVLALDGLVLPDIETYGKALAALRSSLTSSRAALGAETINIYKRTDATGSAAFETAVWFSAAQFFIEDLLNVVDEYDAERDQTLVDASGAEDERLYNRYRLARYAFQLGAITSDRPAMDAAALVLTASDINQSFLAIRGDWINDRAAPDDILGDFPPDNPVSEWGLSVRQIWRIFYLLRQRALVKALKQELQSVGEKLTPETYGSVKRALLAAEQEVPYPERWVPEDYILVWNEADKDTVPDMDTLIHHHPRYEELLAIGDHEQRARVMPQVRSARPIVWLLPDFEEVVKYVLTITKVKQGVEQAFPTEDVTPQSLLEYLDVLAQEDREADRLEREATGKEDADIDTLFDQLMREINGELKGDTDAEVSERDRLFRQATIYDRRVVERYSAELLNAYAKDDSVTNYVLPNKVMDALDMFRRDILPEADRDAHMAALILSLADEMLAAFVKDIGFIFTAIAVEERFDIVTTYFGYIAEALAFWEAGGSDVKLRAILHTSESLDTLAKGTEALETLRDHFVRTIRERQLKFGFRTTADGTKVTDIDGGVDIGVGEAFTIDGITYRITQIHRPFVFHDSYGRHTAAYQPSILKHGDGTPFSKEEREAKLPLITYQILPSEDVEDSAPEPEPASPTDAESEQEDGQATPAQAEPAQPTYPTFTLTSSLDEANELDLERISHVVTMETIVRGLEATAAVIEAYFKGLVTVAELIVMFLPGGAIALMIKDFAQFLLVELPNLKTDVFEEPLQLVAELQEFLSPALRDQMLEKFWAYLLFEGDIPFLEKLQARLSARKKDSRSTSPRGKGAFKTLVEFAKTVGQLVLRAFLNLRQRTRLGMVRAGNFVQRHPLLDRFMSSLPALFSFAELIDTSDIAAVKEFLGDLADGDGPEIVGAKLREALDNVFAGLNEMKVPDEILPMGPVLNLLLDRFLSSLGPRGKLVRAFLDGAEAITDGQFNPMKELSDLLAKQLKSAGLDPNLLWRDLIQGDLQLLLEESRAELILGINTLFNDLLGGLIKVDSGNLQPIEVKTDAPAEVSAPAVQPMMDESLDGETEEDDAEGEPMRRPPSIIPEQGRPLPTALRLRYEERFGHDFRHVRLHHGKHASRLTRYYGAQALTSGSHIFLGERLPPTSAQTESVLRHELAHVLQQTGSRPLDMDQDETPQMGEPGRGLQFDPRREQAAQHMARAASLHRDNPIQVEEENPLGGLFPALSPEMIQRTIDYLGSEKLGKSLVHQLESLNAIPRDISISRKGEFTKAVKDGIKIWKEARKKLMQKTAPTVATHASVATFNGTVARDAIHQYFTSFKKLPAQPNHNHTLLRAFAFYSFEINQNRLELNASLFKNLIEAYLQELVGIHVQIDPIGSNVDYVKVLFIDLDTLNAGTVIYDKMREETNKRMEGQGTPPPVPLRLPDAPRKFDDLEWNRIRHNFGASDVEIWDDKQFRLSDKFIVKMRKKLDTVAGGAADTWDNYTDPNDVANAQFGGLRVGTHGQLTNEPTKQTTGKYATEPAAGQVGAGAMSKETASGRESHHVPQYLLVEYFQNLNPSALNANVAQQVGGKTLFPPGFIPAGSDYSGFQGAGHTIDFAHLDPGSGDRGRGLPAVSLAERTHQRGQLHLNMAANWTPPTIETGPQPTQRVRLHKKFFDVLRSKMSPSPQGNAAKVLEEANKDKSKNEIHVYESLRETYMWMYRNMMARLKTTLETPVEDKNQYEVVSYRTFIEGNTNAFSSPGVPKPDYKPDVSKMDRVMGALKAKNEHIMSEWYKA